MTTDRPSASRSAWRLSAAGGTLARAACCRASARSTAEPTSARRCSSAPRRRSRCGCRPVAPSPSTRPRRFEASNILLGDTTHAFVRHPADASRPPRGPRARPRAATPVPSAGRRRPARRPRSAAPAAQGRGLSRSTPPPPRPASSRALEASEFDVLLMDLNYARDTTSGQEGLDLLHTVRTLDADAAGRRDDRLGQRRPRRRGDAPRRPRLRPEAVGQRAPAGHRPHAGRARRARCAAASGSKPRTCCCAATAQPRPDRRVAGDAAGAADDRARRPVRRQRADHRRERHRQGPGRAGAARRLAARRAAASSPSTPAASPKASSRASCSATCAAPSPTPRPTASAASSWPTAARCSSTRSPTCRSASRPSCCACSRPASSSGSAPRARGAVDVRLISATNADLARRSRGRPLPPGSALPPQHHRDPPAAAARAARGHPGAGHALPAAARAPLPQGRSPASIRRRCRRCSSTPGRATCASSTTPSSAPC